MPWWCTEIQTKIQTKKSAPRTYCVTRLQNNHIRTDFGGHTLADWLESVSNKNNCNNIMNNSHSTSIPSICGKKLKFLTD